MKICFIAPANNYHTIKWCTWFKNRGHEVAVISLVHGTIEGVSIYCLDCGVNVNDSDVKKIKYLFQACKIKKILKNLCPDIINVHYATSYGMLAALAGIRNYILSVWGSDVYEFPNRSIFHKIMLKFSLKKARYIFSTSKAMAEETQKYTNKDILITPFGVDTNLFSPLKRNRLADGEFVIGTIKALKKKYGIDVLLKASGVVLQKRPDINLKIRIAGSGEEEKRLKQLAEKLQINENIVWLGFISQEQAAQEWANMDIGIVVSESESFGVSAVEAQACGVPVIISDIPGLKEATNPNTSSIVVPIGDYFKLADSIVDLYDNPQKRYDMGNNGITYVKNNYNINKCFLHIEKLYKRAIN